MMQALQARKIVRRNKLIDTLILSFSIINFVLIVFTLVFVSIPSHNVFVCPSTASECIYD